jgi:hypothetical protein
MFYSALFSFICITFFPHAFLPKAQSFSLIFKLTLTDSISHCLKWVILSSHLCKAFVSAVHNFES